MEQVIHTDTPYGRALLDAKCSTLRQAPERARRDTLTVAAYTAGRLVAGKQLLDATAREVLAGAAAACGLDDADAGALIESGLAHGLQAPHTPPPTPLAQQALDALRYAQGHKQAGIGIPAYPMLTDALYGLRGFTLLTGPTQAGKTTLTLSVALSVANGACMHGDSGERVPDAERAHVVYVPAERGPVSLIQGMLCLMTGLDMRTLMTGLHTLDDGARELLDHQQGKLQHLLDTTLHVIDPAAVDMGWSEGADRATSNRHPLCGLQRHADAITGGKRCLVIIDTLAHLDVQPAGSMGLPYRSDLDRDTDIARGVKSWRAHLDLSHSALLAVHEESKERTGTGDAHAGRGSSKYAYVADALLALVYADRDGSGTRAMGIRQHDAPNLDGVTEIDLLINKARDGGRSNTTLGLEHHYTRGRVMEVMMWSARQRREQERSLEARAIRQAAARDAK